MKKNFETPEVEMEKFQVEDVLTTSGTEDNKKNWEPTDANDFDIPM